MLARCHKILTIFVIYFNVNFCRNLVCRAYKMITQEKPALFIFNAFLEYLEQEEYIAQSKKGKIMFGSTFFALSLALFKLFQHVWTCHASVSVLLNFKKSGLLLNFKKSGLQTFSTKHQPT